MVFLFFLMIRRPPRSTRIDTLVPYTTLFRSHPVPAVYAVLTNDMHLVALAPHRVGGHIVRDDPVTSLARELRLRVGNEVVRLGGETDQQRRALRTLGQPRENVGILGERQRRSEERRVGEGGVSTCRSRGSP